MIGLKTSLRVEPITTESAVRILTAKHPLGPGHAPGLAFGVYWDGRCEGVMTFGFPITNNAVHRYGLRQDEVLELRKMWMSDVPGKNAESRALAVAAKLIRRRYPHLRLLLTYCDGDEAAAAYKGAGWVPQATHRYLRELVLPGGRRLSVRDANRKGGVSAYPTAEKVFVHRRKWVLPLDPALASVVQPASTLPDQGRDGGANPTRTLSGASQKSSAPTGATTTPTCPHTGTASAADGGSS